MKVFVTGGTGFLGQSVVGELVRKGHDVHPSNSKDYDLYHSTTMWIFTGYDAVIHLAADCGGIAYNQANPAKLWERNLVMGINVLRSASYSKTRLVLVGTTCSYPEKPPRIPFVEEDLFKGCPEPTNAPYGLAKLNVMVGAEAYAVQEGLEYTALIPTNLYGPGDKFHPEYSHVIPGLLRRFHEAKAVHPHPTLKLWGDGTATRDFLYVKDAAKAIVKALDNFTHIKRKWINLGSGSETRILDLAQKVQSVVGGVIPYEWDPSRPNGQPRRCLNVLKSLEHLGEYRDTPLEEGLRQTYEWALKSGTLK